MGLLTPNKDLDCRVLKASGDYLFIYKGPGMHSVAHHEEDDNTVANWLMSYDSRLGQVGPFGQCGLVHRLDFETSGVMVVAQNLEAWKFLRQQFSRHQVTKHYQCEVSGAPEPGVYQAFAGSRYKSSKKVLVYQQTKQKGFRPITTEIMSCQRRWKGSRLHINLISGFRHQIRAHLAYLGYPIWGDVLYGGAPAKQLHLVCSQMAFNDAQQKRHQCQIKNISFLS